jgi:hypothetical protein
MGYFTIFTAYLVAVYLVGTELTKMQVAVITGLFLIMQFFMISGVVGFFWQARVFIDQVREAPLGSIEPHKVALPLLIVGVIVGLKFMWDVRHPKTE